MSKTILWIAVFVSALFIVAGVTWRVLSKIDPVVQTCVSKPVALPATSQAAPSLNAPQSNTLQARLAIGIGLVPAPTKDGVWVLGPSLPDPSEVISFFFAQATPDIQPVFKKWSRRLTGEIEESEIAPAMVALENATDAAARSTQHKGLAEAIGRRFRTIARVSSQDGCMILVELHWRDVENPEAIAAYALAKKIIDDHDAE